MTMTNLPIFHANAEVTAISPAITIDQVMAWNPCSPYDREHVTKLFAGQEKMTAAEIAALDIPSEDRLWALLHTELVGERKLHELACEFAERVVHLCGDDPRPRAAIEVKRSWLRGEASDEELAEAIATAMAAAKNAARVADSDATWATIWAAWAAVWAAHWVAVRAVTWAAMDAAWAVTKAAVSGATSDTADTADTAWAAEQDWQIARILESLVEVQ